jgi:NDP-sugar pyrophosphorylase family protein
MIVLAPIAGGSAHFPPEEYAYPKPLIEVAGRPMISWAIENLAGVAPEVHFVFVASREEARRYSYHRIFDLATGGRSTTLTLGAPTAGALCSCLMAIDAIDPDEPLVIANSDQMIDYDLASIVRAFEAQNADAGVITFDSIHPRWSYVETDAQGIVGRASEKEVISRSAIAGFYYFKRAGSFFDAAMEAVRHNTTTNGQYYISASLNQMILAGLTVRAHPIPAEVYHSFYHPKTVESFQMSGAKAPKAAPPKVPVNLLVPAAGLGSRFAQAGYAKPKPFIDVRGKPMIQRVLDNVKPADARVTVLLQSEHIRHEPAMVEALRAQGVEIAPVDKLTEGTACTLLLARKRFDDDAPLLIANSDQIVDMDINAFVRDCLDRDLDGSILVFEDAARDPKWSFARLGADGLVEEVAEKKAISPYATVGVYLFRRGRDFIAAAIDMIARNERVNNEFYTCPVYNHAIRNGLKIGVYEIPASAMSGIGTPEDLDAYLARTA